MAVTIKFLGHAGFVVSDESRAVAIDPFLTGNPVAVDKPDEIKAQAIVLTHGHPDHVGDTVQIAKANGATVYGAFELCNHLTGQGVENVEPMNPGGKVPTDFGYVALTQAFHSSSNDGGYMGMPCGAVVRFGALTFYHCGDTALFSDMKLIGELYQPDVAAIPVGDRFTMGPEHGAKAAELIKPKIAIPVHYATWPLLVEDISEFTPSGVDVKALKPGESLRVA